MPFLARCPECQHAQVCVLDPESAPRLRCGQCRQYFTAARTPDPTPSPGSPPPVEAERAKPVRVAAPAAVLAAPPYVPGPILPILESDEPPTPLIQKLTSGWTAPLTMTALSLLALALVAAPFQSLGFLVRPLAGLSLVIGLVAVRSIYRNRGKLWQPVTVTSVAAGVLLAALLVPSFLGPSYENTREPARADSGVRVVPLAGYAHEADQLGTEWVDARKATLQQGRVRVEVPEAWIGSSLKTDGRESAGTWLYLRVRLYRGRTGAEIASGAFAPALVWNDQARATVRDAAGATYEQLPYRPPAAKAGGASSAAGLSLDVSDEILTFEAPAALASGLRLELPGAAWGGSGAFRFAVPAEMVEIRTKRPAGIRGS